MAPHTDEAHRSDREPGEVQRIVAGVIRQTGLGHDRRGPVQIALGVLDRDDVGMRGERPQGVPLDGNHRARRDVVEHDRKIGGVGDGAEMCDEAGLRRPRVVRGDHQQAVRTHGGGRFRQVHAVRGVVGADAGDDARPVPDGFEHHRQQSGLLVIGGGRRLPGGAGHHQPVAAAVDQAHRQAGGGLGVEGALGGERSGHRGQNRAQPGAGVESAGTHGPLGYLLGPIRP